MSKRPKISANIARLFPELPLMERIGAAAEAGFDGVELPEPYDQPVPELRDKAVFANLPWVRLDAPPPNYTGGPQGFAGVKAVEQRFRRDVTRVLRQAQVLRIQQLHLRTGAAEQGQQDTLIENLKWAVSEAPKTQFLLSLLNAQEAPGHCMAGLQSAFDTLDAIGSPNVRLMLSTTTAQASGLDLSATWETCHDKVGHIILGGSNAGEDDHNADKMIELVKSSGYTGWLCADYAPRETTKKSLTWLK